MMNLILIIFNNIISNKKYQNPNTIICLINKKIKAIITDHKFFKVNKIIVIKLK
jgi:hypothetical protein